MELSDPKIKMFLIFSYTSELELSSLKNKRFLIFIKKKKKRKILSYIFSKKVFLIFQELELSSSGFKSSHISGGAIKASKTKISYTSPKKFANKFF